MKAEWLKEIEAIGWDLDGTLYSPDAIPRNLVHEKQIEAVMAARGWSRRQAEEEWRAVISIVGSSTQTMSELGADGPGFFRTLWDELPLDQYIRVDDTLVAMFKRLSAYRHFIVSNSNTKAQIERKLRLIGIPDNQFEMLISTDELGVVKPNPLPFKMALTHLGLSPQLALYVGDRVETDIVGARKVGMKTCLVGGESELADICIARVYDLADLMVG